jgi:hypothetical protein
LLRLHGLQTAAAAFEPSAAVLADHRVKRFGAGKVFYKIGMYAIKKVNTLFQEYIVSVF